VKSVDLNCLTADLSCPATKNDLFASIRTDGTEIEMTQLAYGIAEVCEIAGIGRTTVYSAINDGALKARKIGRRTVNRKS
jgi:excisionase family DNA binding protein